MGGLGRLANWIAITLLALSILRSFFSSGKESLEERLQRSIRAKVSYTNEEFGRELEELSQKNAEWIHQLQVDGSQEQEQAVFYLLEAIKQSIKEALPGLLSCECEITKCVIRPTEGSVMNVTVCFEVHFAGYIGRNTLDLKRDPGHLDQVQVMRLTLTKDA